MWTVRVSMWLRTRLASKLMLIPSDGWMRIVITFGSTCLRFARANSACGVRLRWTVISVKGFASRLPEAFVERKPAKICDLRKHVYSRKSLPGSW